MQRLISYNLLHAAPAALLNILPPPLAVLNIIYGTKLVMAVNERLGGPSKHAPPKLGARRACHSLFALGGRHHDGIGGGWGGAGGVEVEMFPPPTL